jgi:hypothetical protein
MGSLTSVVRTDDEDCALGLVGDSLAHTAERAQAVQATAPDDEEVGLPRGVDQHFERLDPLQGFDVKVLATTRRKSSHGHVEALTQLACHVVRAAGRVRSVHTDDDR